MTPEERKLDVNWSVVPDSLPKLFGSICCCYLNLAQNGDILQDSILNLFLMVNLVFLLLRLYPMDKRVNLEVQDVTILAYLVQDAGILCFAH